jgi:hypothetical protein
MSKTDLKSKTKAELLKLAQRLGLRGISTMNKDTLVDAITRAQSRPSTIKRQPLGVTAIAKKVAADIKRRAIRKRDADKIAATGAAAKQPTPARATRRSPVTPTRKEQAASTAAATELSAHKFDVAPAKTPPPKQVFVEEQLGELPDSYGTGRLFLVARDPHWLFAYWDLSGQQMADYRRQASDGRLVLRLFEKNHPAPIQELTLHPDSRNWYLPVNKAATTYHGELGFWRHDGSFHVISRSRETATPPDAVSADQTARFATIPIDIPFSELLQIIRGHLRQGERLAEAMHRLQREGFKFPFKVGVEFGPWTAEQAAELERMLGGDVLRRMQVGSFEITEWLRRRLQEELSSGMFSAFSPAGASWAGAQPQRGFWLAVNAELIIYGATEPDAKVTIDGKPVKLRSDGTFSFHHTFPDGQYRLPIVAVSAKGDDERAVALQFERTTTTKGEVGKVKAPGHLKSPAAV